MLGFNEISVKIPVMAPGVSENWDKDVQSGPAEIYLHYGAEDFDKPVHATLREESPFVGLYFNLAQDLSYKFQSRDLSAGILTKGHYLFAYLPHPCCHYDVGPGPVRTFRIHLPIDLVKSFAADQPFLSRTLEMMEQKRPYLLGELPFTTDAHAFVAIQSILSCMRTGLVRDAQIVSQVMTILMYCFNSISSGETNPPASTDDRITKAMRYVEENLSTQICLDLMADELGIDPKTLTRYFHKWFNMTVMQYAFNEKMKRAMDLIRHTNYSICDVARQLGYKKGPFNEAFKRHFNRTPTSIRRDSSSGNMAV